MVNEEIINKWRYDPETGYIYHRLGRLAGCIAAPNSYSNGYREIFYKGKRYLQHEVAWLLYYGRWSSLVIDHINRDKTDNRIKNLREVSLHVYLDSRADSKHHGVYIDDSGIVRINILGFSQGFSLSKYKEDGILAAAKWVRIYLEKFPNADHQWIRKAVRQIILVRSFNDGDARQVVYSDISRAQKMLKLHNDYRFTYAEIAPYFNLNGSRIGAIIHKEEIRMHRKARFRL